MAMLLFADPVKLSTKKIIFEEVLQTRDAGSLEQLKDLSSKRKAFCESFCRSNSMTDAIAREISGGLTSHCEQDLQKLEQYLPLLHNLVYYIGLAGDNSNISRWITNLKIRWSSGLYLSSTFSLSGPKFFQINNLQFEVSMTLSLYGAMLRQRASEAISVDLVQSATFYRKAAGVYDFLATMVNPSLQVEKAPEKPPEISSSVSNVMRLICLAEAQAVTIKKAEGNGTSGGLLAKLHRGSAQLLDEASVILKEAKKEYKDISSRLLDYIISSKALHELKSEKYLAEAHTKDGKLGFAIGLLQRALENTNKKISGDDSWRLIFKNEINEVASLLKKYKHENEFVWHEKTPLLNELPKPEITIIVKHIAYIPERWERGIAFII